MRLPVIQGVIRRRILVNFRVDPAVMQRQLPAPFRPKLVGDAAMAGVCLIRLEHLRPRLVPAALGLASENAAHRVAVTWVDEHGRTREGVYIPRRDSDSPVNRLVGGRLFPGEHRPARFAVRDAEGSIELSMRSDDGETAVYLRARPATRLPATSRFASLAEASSFFEAGAVGFSPRRNGDHLDGLCLDTDAWRVEPLAVEEVWSSYFGDPPRFPSGSVEFDCALIMRDIAHTWQNVPDFGVDKSSLPLGGQGNIMRTESVDVLPQVRGGADR
jgi:hypothetical protein